MAEVFKFLAGAAIFGVALTLSYWVLYFLGMVKLAFERRKTTGMFTVEPRPGLSMTAHVAEGAQLLVGIAVVCAVAVAMGIVFYRLGSMVL